ncbi:MAG: Flp pilus assembly complex ATPase component TadA [Candidatus Thermoplasmatota archaeon]|nr:Flp pilus assembly complex ATPase component TadA [Candidatus Thermoplasmatota archaeon]
MLKRRRLKNPTSSGTLTPATDEQGHENVDNRAELPKGLQPGRELIYFFQHIKKRIGEDEFKHAHDKKNTLKIHIFEALNELNLLSYQDIARFAVEVFSPYLDAEYGSFDKIDFRGREAYLHGDPVSVVSYPSFGALHAKQIVLPYNEFQSYENYMNGTISRSEKEVEKRTNLAGHEVSFSFKDIVLDAKKQKVSDIHITYSSNVYNVLFVIDGLSVDQKKYVMNIEQGMQFVRQIKLEAGKSTMGEFNSEISYKAQDARIEYPEINIDLRLVFIPDGMLRHNSVTARLLIKQSIERGEFDFVGKMNYDQKFVDAINLVKHQRNGLFIASGVTGSGKSTLVSHILATIPENQRIYSIEDPIEIRLDGPNITQHQIYKPPKKEGTESKQMDWPEYIKALKRAAPDIANIGELRNTPGLSAMVVEIAEAGQLVFTTVHIKSAFGIYDVLEEVFKIPYKTSVKLILFSTNQVLSRMLCPHCKIKDKEGVNRQRLEELYESGGIRFAYTRDLMGFLEKKNNESSPHTYLRNDDGCPKCGHTGYLGRVPINEYYKVTQSLSEWLLDRRKEPHEIEKEVCKQGIGTNKLSRYIQLIELGMVDTSPDILRKIL